MAVEGVASVVRRNRPGTKADEWCIWPDEPFEEMDSTLAVQQFIQQAIRRDFNNVDEILNPPEGQDEGVWKYEHLRQFCMELNGLAVKLQDDNYTLLMLAGVDSLESRRDQLTKRFFTCSVLPESSCLHYLLPDKRDTSVTRRLRQARTFQSLSCRTPECNPETCTQMTATEQWIFLCAAHKTPKECPAIDYTRHTLDGAACLLNSNKYFPSRVSIKESSVAKLGSVCRRVYRIFSHAYFHHRPIFDEYESETALCRRFTVFVTKYNLMSKDNLIVPNMDDQLEVNESEA